MLWPLSPFKFLRLYCWVKTKFTATLEMMCHVFGSVQMNDRDKLIDNVLIMTVLYIYFVFLPVPCICTCTITTISFIFKLYQLTSYYIEVRQDIEKWYLFIMFKCWFPPCMHVNHTIVFFFFFFFFFDGPCSVILSPTNDQFTLSFVMFKDHVD